MKGKPLMTLICPSSILICQNKLLRHLFSVILSLGSVVLITIPASAQEDLRFREAMGFKELKIIQFLQKNTQRPDIKYFLSATDLNDDFIDEYILRPESPQSCPKAPICPTYIIALQQREPVILGQFDAHKMAVSRKKNYGVRQISVYTALYNDFDVETAIWNPHNFAYELSEAVP